MNQAFRLPALRSLGNLADVQPTLVIDTREQEPLQFSRLESIQLTLTTGDYSVAGLEELFCVERKSIADLAACCVGQNRERFERELHRLRGYRRLLIVGSEVDIQQHRYRPKLTPKAIFSTLSAFEVRFDCPAVFSTLQSMRPDKSNRGPFGSPVR
jgi:DNA excision repair protein ERCC-4